MPNVSDYHDKRVDFFKAHFAKALNYQDYLATGEETHRERWIQHYQAIQQKRPEPICGPGVRIEQLNGG